MVNINTAIYDLTDKGPLTTVTLHMVVLASYLVSNSGCISTLFLADLV